MKTVRTELSKQRINKKMAKKGFDINYISKMCKAATVYINSSSNERVMVVFDRVMQRINKKYGAIA